MIITSVLVIFSALIAATYAVPGYIEGYSSIGWPGLNDANYKYAHTLGGYKNYLYGGYGNGYGYGGYGGYGGLVGYGANGYVINYGAHYAPKTYLGPYGYGGSGGYLSGIYGYNPYYYK